MIALRKQIPAFADFNNRELLDPRDPKVFAFLRTDPEMGAESVLVLANFGLEPAALDPVDLGGRGLSRYPQLFDLHAGAPVELVDGRLVVPRYDSLWLTSRRPTTVL